MNKYIKKSVVVYRLSVKKVTFSKYFFFQQMSVCTLVFEVKFQQQFLVFRICLKNSLCEFNSNSNNILWHVKYKCFLHSSNDCCSFCLCVYYFRYQHVADHSITYYTEKRHLLLLKFEQIPPLSLIYIKIKVLNSHSIRTVSLTNMDVFYISITISFMLIYNIPILK